jgi:cation:H+ antiporter
MEIIVFVVALAVILLGAELFTNGIEWFGHRLKLGEGAVGSVLAAVATALPETLIPVIAILGPIFTGQPGSEGAEEVGVGAILGAPFTLATLAMFITGIAVILFARRGRRTTDMAVNVEIMSQDVIYFLVGYGIAIGAAFLPIEWHWADYIVVLALVVIYVLYVRAHFRSEAPAEAPELALLHAVRLPWLRGDIGVHPAVETTPIEHQGQPRLWVIVAQTLIALGLIILGARVFVTALEDISLAIGFDPRLFAFQACFPTAIGILFTTWAFTPESALSFASAGAAILATVLILGPMMRSHRLRAAGLLIGGPIYLVYVLAVILLPSGG